MSERKRDERGRFVKNPPTYVIIDDFGNEGPIRDHERYFGYAVSKTKNLEDFEKLAEENSRLHGKPNGEIKASRDSMYNKIRMTLKIRTLGAETSAYYVDKEYPPKSWRHEKTTKESKNARKRLQKKHRNDLLDKTIEKSVKNTNGEIIVIVDNHNLNSNVPSKCATKSNSRRKVTGNQYDSTNGKYSRALQTHDYVANAGYNAARGFGVRARILNMKLFKQK